MCNNQFVNNWLFDDPIKGYSMMMDGCSMILNLVFGGGHQHTMLYLEFFSSVFMLVGVNRVSLARFTYVIEDSSEQCSFSKSRRERAR